MADCQFDEDKWIRIFNVSDPRKAVAGHTVYRVSSKVFPKDFPEACTEIVVWRRFSDFKRLHKKLVKIYNHKFKDDNFPELPKAKYFGRFEEGVIEERRQSILELLNFAGSIPSLFTSQPFVQFFEDGIPSSPSGATLSSRQSSVVSDEVDIGIVVEDVGLADSKTTYQQGSKELSSNITWSKTTNDVEDTLGGVWLCKQPSEVEGLDKLASDEEDAESCRGDNTDPRTDTKQCVSHIPDIPENNVHQPSGTAPNQTEGQDTKVSQDSEWKTRSKVYTDNDDVFATDSLDEFVVDPEESEKDTAEIPPEPPQWLTRAISICSEGEDLEVLASKADAEDSCNDLGFPRAFSDQEETDMQIIRNSNSNKSGQASYLKSKSSPSDTARSSNSSSPREKKNEQTVDSNPKLSADKASEPDLAMDVDNKGQISKFPKYDDQSFENDRRNVIATQVHDKKNQQDISSLSSKVSITSSQRLAEDVSSSETRLRPGEALQEKLIPDLVNIAPAESDYLVTAARAIHKALNCEVNGMYEDAFNLYKKCVGLLLSGVQGEKDAKRRDAVRRKTAQYLLKAEAIYNVHLADREICDSSSDVGEMQEQQPTIQSENKFKDLSLHDLKVIGIINKVMLVEHVQTQETFVIKVLHKVARCSHRDSKGSDSRRRKLIRKIISRHQFMVCLHKYFETANAIYLLLQHARGGLLWDYLSSCDFLGDGRELSECRNKFYDFTDEREVVHGISSSSSSSLDSSSLEHQRSEKNSLYVGGLDIDQGTGDQVINAAGRVRVNDNCEKSKTFLKYTGVCDCSTDSETGNQNNFSPHSLPTSTENCGLATNDKLCNYNKEFQSLLDKRVLVTDDRKSRGSNRASNSEEEVNAEIQTQKPVSKTSLFAKLDKYFSASNKKLSEDQIRYWVAEIILALSNLHACGIVCRDFHPGNILLDEEGHVLLTYFGAWDEVESQLSDQAIEDCYCAPEVLKSEQVEAAADWWSVGALLFEMLTGKSLAVCHPWRVRSHTELQFPNHVSAEARGLIRELLQVHPTERLGGGTSGVEEIKSHPFFLGIDWIALASKPPR